jgi:hypothetical protein
LNLVMFPFSGRIYLYLDDKFADPSMSGWSSSPWENHYTRISTGRSMIICVGARAKRKSSAFTRANPIRSRIGGPKISRVNSMMNQPAASSYEFSSERRRPVGRSYRRFADSDPPSGALDRERLQQSISHLRTTRKRREFGLRSGLRSQQAVTRLRTHKQGSGSPRDVRRSREMLGVCDFGPPLLAIRSPVRSFEAAFAEQAARRAAGR